MVPSHLQIGNLVSEARDEDNKRPVIGLHHHPSSLGTAHMEGGGAAAVRALHTTASVPFPPLLTKYTPLHRRERQHTIPWNGRPSLPVSPPICTKASHQKPTSFQYMGAPRDCSTPVPHVKYPGGNTAVG